MANTILKELREFRTENNKRWEANDKRWEENDKHWKENEKRWVENDKRWEENNEHWQENEKRWVENDRRWEENNKHWQENEKRWIENDKRWEENDKHWQENEKRWIENDKRWNENNKKWEENTTILAGINERLIVLEEGRKKDRKDLLGILDTMQKSIDNQFSEIKEDMNSKFEKVFTLQKLNEMEHQEFRKLLLTHDKRINFQSARLKYLEEWKEQFDMGEFTAV